MDMDFKEMQNLYENQDKSYKDIAKIYKKSMYTVFRFMKKNGINSKPFRPRNQGKDNNNAWKGKEAGYSALHLRVTAKRGRPRYCEVCGCTEAKIFEWANLTGNYSDVSDYKRMCRSCHRKYDKTNKQPIQFYKIPTKRIGRIGQSNGQAKLNDEQVLAIRAEYSLGEISTRSLGIKYGVTSTLISRITSRKAWKHI